MPSSPTVTGRYSRHSAQADAPEDTTTAVIHNALSRPELLQIDPSDKAAAKRAIGLQTPTQKILLSVARMDRGKGQGDLIRLMARPSAHNRKLILLGEGPESEGLQALAHSLGVAKQVHFAGFCEQSRIYYAAADLFLSASGLDSLPNALIEAQAAALPIIAYPTAGIPEIIDDPRTGRLVQHGDIAIDAPPRREPAGAPFEHCNHGSRRPRNNDRKI